MLSSAHSASGGGGGSGGKRPGSSHWLPALPAALSALPAVLNRTESVVKTAQRFLQEQLQPAAAAAATRSRGRGQTAVELAGSARLCNICSLNGFLSSAVCIAGAHAAAGDDDAAVMEAKAALQVATALLAKRLVAIQMAAATARALGPNSSMAGDTQTSTPSQTSAAELSPDAVTYSCLLQLYGMTGQYQ